MADDNILTELRSKLLDTNEPNHVRNIAVVTAVQNHQLTLLQVLEKLGDVFTSENVVIRCRGLDILSWILSELPENDLNEKEIAVITRFYCDRLLDHHSLNPSVFQGILAIVKMQNVTKEDIGLLLTKLFQEISCQRQLQPDRAVIYKIFQVLFERKMDHILPMGPDFVFGIISFVEGETDPYNLLFLFKIYPQFLKVFPLGHLSQEVFEVVSSYFPVDFNSMERDKVVITRDDLAAALAVCLCSVPSWSEFCIPLLVDKLSSSLKTAKLDSYNLLEQCCTIYTVQQVEVHLNELWKLIIKDVLPGLDEDVCRAALFSLAALVELLSREASDKLNLFLNDIILSVLSLLKKADDSLFAPSMRVLTAVCSRSQPATKVILCHLQPLCSPDFAKSCIERKILLSTLFPFLSLCRKADLVESADYRTLLVVFLQSARSLDSDVRLLAFRAIQDNCADFYQVLKEELFDLLRDSCQVESTREICGRVLRHLACNYPNEVKLGLVGSLVKNDQSLVSLSAIADLPEFTADVVPRLLAEVESQQVLESLLAVCRLENNYTTVFHVSLLKEFDVVSRLTQWAVDRCLPAERLASAAAVVHHVTRHQDQPTQAQMLQIFLPQLLTPQPLVAKVVILEAILGSVKPEVIIPNTDLERLLMDAALFSAEETTRNCCGRLLASFVVKYSADAARRLLEVTKERTLQCSDSHAAAMLSWIMKGVLLRGGDDVELWTSWWLGLLSRKDIGCAVAEGFKTVMAEETSYLSFQSHCSVKILYRQRLFGKFREVFQAYESCEMDVKENYLLAMAHLIQGVPKHVVTAELKNAVVVLVRSLESDRTEMLLSCLSTTAQLLEDREPLLQEHLSSFLPKLLLLSQYQASMRTRIAALQCLFHFAFYPTMLLLPFKPEVLRGLESCLDDRKRLVRAEAVKARSRWYLVGAPGESDVYSS